MAAQKTCVLVARDQRVDTGTLRELRDHLEDTLRSLSDAELVPSSACIRAGRELGVSPRKWTEQPYLRQLAGEAGVEVVVTGIYKRKRRLRVVAIDAQTGEVIGTQTVRFRRIHRIESALGRWMKRRAQAISDEEEFEEAVAEGAAAAPVAQQVDQDAKPEGADGALSSEESGDVAEPGDDEEGQAPAEEAAEDSAWSFSEDAFTSVSDDSGGAATVTAVAGGNGGLPKGLSFRGRAYLEHFTYFRNLEPGRVAARNSADISLSTVYKSNLFSAAAGLRARRDLSDSSRDLFLPGEIYAEVHKSPFRLRAGRFIDSWGRGSLASPSDVLNPVDVTDPLMIEKYRPTWRRAMSRSVELP